MPIKPPAPRYAQHPFEVCAMASFMFSCLSLALFGPQTGKASDYPATYQVILAIAVLMGSLLVMTGAYWRDVIMGAVLELAGLIVVGGFVLVWFLGVSSKTTNWSSGLGACALASIFVACVWRGTQIIKWFRWVYRDHPPEFWEARATREAFHRLSDGPPIVDPAELNMFKYEPLMPDIDTGNDNDANANGADTDEGF